MYEADGPCAARKFPFLCLFFLFFVKFLDLFYVYEYLPSCVLVYHVHAVLMEVRKGHKVLWNYSYEWL